MPPALTDVSDGVRGLQPVGEKSQSAAPISSERTAGIVRMSEASDLNKDFLLASIVYDLLWTALHVGTLAILLNACARADAHWTLRSWRHLLFDNNKIMQLGLRYGPEIGLTAELSASTAKFYTDVAAEKLRLSPLVQVATSYSATQRQQVVAACTAWRRLAQNANSLLAALEVAVMGRLEDVLVEDKRILRRFLDEAAAGSTKRVSSSGEIALPVLKQMRRDPRVAIEGQCTLMLGDECIAASLKDISACGLGIVCDRPLADKQPVTVVMADGRQIKGRVVSRRGAEVGLVFDARLNRDDPLFHRESAERRGAQRRDAN